MIMVGEMRDAETAKTGIEASLTGHLVLSTLHTNSAPESVVRLLDMGMDPFNFADARLGVLAQRLARGLCASCKKPYLPDAQELEELSNEYCLEISLDKDRVLHEWRGQYGDARGDLHLYRAPGCEHCGRTGYRGRVGLHELLLADAAVKRLIQTHAAVTDIKEAAMAAGMRTLKQNGIEKILRGLTDIAQVRAAFVARPHLVDAAQRFIGMQVMSPLDTPAEIWLITRWADEASYRTSHTSHSDHGSHAGIPKGLMPMKKPASGQSMRRFRKITSQPACRYRA